MKRRLGWWRLSGRALTACITSAHLSFAFLSVSAKKRIAVWKGWRDGILGPPEERKEEWRTREPAPARDCFSTATAKAAGSFELSAFIIDFKLHISCRLSGDLYFHCTNRCDHVAVKVLWHCKPSGVCASKTSQSTQLLLLLHGSACTNLFRLDLLYVLRVVPSLGWSWAVFRGSERMDSSEIRCWVRSHGWLYVSPQRTLARTDLITHGYSTAAISFANGTTTNVAKLDGGAEYNEVMARLSLASSEHPRSVPSRDLSYRTLTQLAAHRITATANPKTACASGNAN